ncbi:hypothetical protein GPECTOR_1g465 [Gonium pectorale]|uniref:Protein kinase domain-containing protein n=1 Tax=Gonium pectorale TaxID=33097 RepID=A0A150H3W9_GONPE|nr:hypothetical protein GPECTOR_1g465 [Gonium pectorale]|eukprot:KXZ56518.1 hypothetical protein GPECTOR_1g465 [Gonium pectorale]
MWLRRAANSRLSGASSVNTVTTAVTNAPINSSSAAMAAGPGGAAGVFVGSVCSTPAVAGGPRGRRDRATSSSVVSAVAGGVCNAEEEDGASLGAAGVGLAPGRASTSSALLLMTPRDLLATATATGPGRMGHGADREHLSTLGGDELSTVGSYASAGTYQLPLLATRPSMMEEGGLGYADLMKGAGWRAPGGMGMGLGYGMGMGMGLGGGPGMATSIGGGISPERSQPPSPLGRPPPPLQPQLSAQTSAAGLGSSVGLPSGEDLLSPALSLGVYAAASRAVGATVAPGCALGDASNKGSSPDTPFASASPAATWRPFGLPQQVGGVSPAGSLLGPLSRLKSSSWSKIRSIGRRAPASSILSYVPEEDPRSPPATATTQPLEVAAHRHSCGSCEQPAHADNEYAGTVLVDTFGPGSDSALLGQLPPAPEPQRLTGIASPAGGLGACLHGGSADGGVGTDGAFAKLVHAHPVSLQQVNQELGAKAGGEAGRLGVPRGDGVGAEPGGEATAKLPAPTVAPLAQTRSADAARPASMVASVPQDASLTLDWARMRLPRLQIPRTSESGLGSLIMVPSGAAAGDSCPAAVQAAVGATADGAPKANPANAVALAAGLPRADASATVPERMAWVSVPGPVCNESSLQPVPASAATVHGPGVAEDLISSQAGTSRRLLSGLPVPFLPAGVEARGQLRGSSGGAPSEHSCLNLTPRTATAAAASAVSIFHAGSPSASSAWPSRLFNDNSVLFDMDSGALALGLASPVLRPQLLAGGAPPFSRQQSHVLQISCPSEVVLHKLIGQGCAGRVYKGTWRDQLVAIKVITHPQADAQQPQDERIKKIEQEAALGICLDHPNIVATYAAFTTVTSPQLQLQPPQGALSRQSSTAGYQALHLHSLSLDRVPQLRGAPYSGAAPPRSRSLQPHANPQYPFQQEQQQQQAGTRGGYSHSHSLASPAATQATCAHAAVGHSPPRGSGLSSRPVSRQASASSGFLSVSMAPGSPAVRGGGGSGHLVDLCPSPAASGPGGIAGFGGAGGGGAMWTTFIVMELCQRGSLRSALDSKKLHDKRGAPRMHEVLPLAWEVACALQYLHANGVVHGDLKAANVMLSEAASSPPDSELDSAWLAGPTAQASQGMEPSSPAPTPRAQATKGKPSYTAKVADFSHSYQVELALRRLRETSGAAGAADVSSSHAAPELFEEGAMPTMQSDIYSLGVVLWELYGGRKPYDKYRTAGEVMAAKRNLPTEQVLTVPDTWPQEYAGLCRRCWLAPGERPPLDVIVTALSELCRAHLPHVELCPPTTIAADTDLTELEAAEGMGDELPTMSMEEVGGASGEAIMTLPQGRLQRSAGSRFGRTVVVDPGFMALPDLACTAPTTGTGMVPVTGPSTQLQATSPAASPRVCHEAEVLRDYVYGPVPARATSAVRQGQLPLPPMPALPPALMGAAPGGPAIGNWAVAGSAAPPAAISDTSASGRLLMPLARPRMSEDPSVPRGEDCARAGVPFHSNFSCPMGSRTGDTSVVSPAATTTVLPHHTSVTTFASSSTSVRSIGNLTASATIQSGKPSSRMLCEDELSAALLMGLPPSLGPLQQQPHAQHLPAGSGRPELQFGLPFPWPAVQRLTASSRNISAVSLNRAHGGSGDELQAEQGGGLGSAGVEGVSNGVADAAPLRSVFASSRTRGSHGSRGSGCEWPWGAPSPFSSSTAVALMSERSVAAVNTPDASVSRQGSLRAPHGSDALAQASSGWSRGTVGTALSVAGAPAGGVIAAAAGSGSGQLQGYASGTPTRHTRRTASAHHEPPSMRLEPLPEMESCHLHLRPEQLREPPAAPHMPFLDPCPLDASTSALVEMLPPLDIPGSRVPLPPPSPSAAHGGPNDGAIAGQASSGDGGLVSYAQSASGLDAYVDTPQATPGGGAPRRASTLTEVSYFAAAGDLSPQSPARPDCEPAAMFDSGSMYGNMAAGAAPAPGAPASVTTLARQSQGYNSTSSFGVARQKLRQHSRMFTTEDLEAR